MDHHHKKLLCLYISVFFLNFNAYTQKLPDAWLKAEYIVVLTSYFTWPDEAAMDTFRIGILGADEVYSMLGLKQDLDTLKDMPVSVEALQEGQGCLGRPDSVYWEGQACLTQESLQKV